MNKKRIILHIGLPKTGTTALQRWCHQHRAELLKNGIYYPENIESEEDPKHQFLLRNLKAGNFEELENILNQTPYENIALSTEALSNQFLDFQDFQLEKFRNVMSGYKITIFMVGRQHDSWLKSYYHQCVINPPVHMYPYATHLTYKDFSLLDRVKFLVNLPKQKNILAKAFGSQDIIIADYEKNWFGKWLEILGFPTIHATLQSSNDSLDSDAISLVVEINKSNLSAGARSLILSAIQEVTGVNNTILRGYSSFPFVLSDKEEALNFLTSIRLLRGEALVMTNKVKHQIMSRDFHGDSRINSFG